MNYVPRLSTPLLFYDVIHLLLQPFVSSRPTEFPTNKLFEVKWKQPKISGTNETNWRSTDVHRYYYYYCANDGLSKAFSKFFENYNDCIAYMTFKFYD